jgi:hypothetical protein
MKKTQFTEYQTPARYSLNHNTLPVDAGKAVGFKRSNPRLCTLS